jgi:Mycobacterium membrane protein
VVEPGVRDVHVAEARSDLAVADRREVGQPSGVAFPGLDRPPAPAPPAPQAPRISRRTRRSGIIQLVRRLWIPLVIVVVIGAGGLTVSRLHNIFGSEKRPAYADSQLKDPAPFDPKHLTYEVFGPPGTVAKISYFDVNADPKRIDAAPLPWSLTFAMTDATAVGNVVAQGDSDLIGCRIVVDGVVRAERSVEETNAFTFCSLKAS